MICKVCGAKMLEDDKFCESCEAGRSNGILPDQEKVAENGGVRWLYELKMWQNPTLIITAFKVMMLAALIPSLLVVALEMIEGNDALASMILFIKLYGGILLILTLLMGAAYGVVALINGGKYCVLFEMDDQGIRHTQLRKQYQKAQALGRLTTIVGSLSGSPSTMGAGLLAASKRSLYSRFQDVKSLSIYRSRHVIYLTTKDEVHNQVYVEQDDFQNVTDHIVSHVPIKTPICYK
ncbi:MAG: zinc ribbon domain-containing protein [Erysipelotrichales bacterium]|nr:MAG: zinc ribbon domain-containing protein [Erysipelotrichales bacterium]